MYYVVKGSRGKAPSFAITVGMREGYGTDAKTHRVEEMISLVENHLRMLAASGKPYLTGSVMTGTVVYAWPEGEGNAGSGNEPQATFCGEVNPLHNSGLSQKDIEKILNTMATELGKAFGQTRVYVAFNGDLWILQAEGKDTPSDG